MWRVILKRIGHCAGIVLFWVLLTAVGVSLSLFVLFQIPGVQKWTARRASKLIQEKAGISFSLDRISYAPPLRIRLDNLLVHDMHGDTLLYTDVLSTSIIGTSNGGRGILLGHTRLKRGAFYLLTDSMGVLNIRPILAILRGEDPTSTKPGFAVDISTIAFEKVRFRFFKPGHEDVSGRVNYKNLDLSNIAGRIAHFRSIKDTVRMIIKDLSFHDRSGFRMQHMKGRMALCSHSMHYQEMHIETPLSRIVFENLRMDYEGWGALSNFTREVELDAAFEPSRINTQTLSYFISLPEGRLLEVGVQGALRGRINDFNLSGLEIRTGDDTHLSLSGMLTGLPSVHDAIVSIEIDDFRTSMRDVEHISGVFSLREMRLPAELRAVRNLSYRGTMVGFLDDFVAYGNVRSNLGNMALDISVGMQPEGGLRFGGKVQANALNLGAIAQESLLGRATFTASVRGQTLRNGGVKAKVAARIKEIEVYGHNYHAIDLEGLITPKSYSGELRVADSALNLTFGGEVSLADAEPIFNFTLHAPRIDLHAMNINRTDSISELSLEMEALSCGKTLDNIAGEVRFPKLTYTNQRGHFSLHGLRIGSSNVLGGKLIALDSPVLRGTLWGESRYAEVLPRLRELIAGHLPAWFQNDTAQIAVRNNATPPTSTSLGSYRAEFHVGACDTLLQVLFPTVHVAKGTNLNCGFRPAEGSFDVRLQSKLIGFKKMVAHGLDLSATREEESVRLRMNLNAGEISRILLDSVTLGMEMGVDTVISQLRLCAPSLAMEEMRMNWTSIFYPQDSVYPQQLLMRIDSTRMRVDGLDWLLSRARIVLDTASLQVSNFHVQNADRRLSVQGRASKSPTDTLRLHFDNVDLQLFGALVTPVRIGGICRGGVVVSSLFATPFLSADIRLNELTLNGARIGNTDLKGRWYDLEQPLQLTVTNQAIGGEEDFRLQASWNVKKKHIDGNLELEDWNLAPINALSNGAIAPRGRLKGQVRIAGPLSALKTNGALTFIETDIFSRDLNTYFSTISTLRFLGDKLLLEDFTLHDAQKRELKLNGSVQFRDLRKPFINVTAESDHFTLLNTSALYNPLYSGRLVATTHVQARGTPDDLRLKLHVRTDPGTSLAFQLPTTRQARESQQLIFAKKATDSIEELQVQLGVVPPRYSSKLNLSADLEVTNSALTELVINAQSGELLSARGAGNLHVTTDATRKTLEIFGDYTIERGEYSFVFENLLSKKFRISQGSTIRFSGPLQKASADITAIYKTRASLENLLGEMADEKYKRRVPVECKLRVRGTLQKPRLSFEIEIPQADAETQGLVASALNTEEKLVRQFASLLLLNTFTADTRSQRQVATREGQNPETGGGVAIDDVLLSSFWELLSNQLNSWFAQIENAPSIDVGFNYRPGDSSTPLAEDEAEISLSMQWFDGRLNIDANWDVNKNNTSSAVAGDIVVTQQSMLMKNLRYKAFAQSNDDLVFNDLNPYTAGVGVVYSDSFNSWSEVWQRIRNFFKRKKKAKNDETLLPEEEEEEIGIETNPNQEENEEVAEIGKD